MRGVFRQLSNALVKSEHQPTVRQMYRIYLDVRQAAPLVMRDTGANSLFEAGVFKRLVVTAT